MKQRIRHDAIIDVLTPDELKQIIMGREEGHTGLFDVVVGNFASGGSAAVLMTTPPMRRLRVPRRGNGAASFPVPVANAVEVLQVNEGRIGGQIVNSGANACILYLGPLSDIGQGDIPAIWISANGGSWDFKVSSVMWGGTICAQAITANTTLSIVEL